MRGKEYPRCVVAPSTIADLSARKAIRFEIHLALHGTSNLSNPIFYPAERGIARSIVDFSMHCFRGYRSGRKRKRNFLEEMYRISFFLCVGKENRKFIEKSRSQSQIVMGSSWENWWKKESKIRVIRLSSIFLCVSFERASLREP